MVNGGSTHAPASVVDLLAAVVELLGLADIREHDDLFEHGLDSLDLIKLAASLRKGGTEISFEELAAEPMLNHWSGLLARQVDPASGLTEPTGLARPEPDAPFDLATAQYAYWIGRQDGQPLGGVGAHFHTEFDGRDVAPERLAAALRAVMGVYGRSARWHHWIGPQDALRLSANPQRHGVTMAAALAIAFAEVMSAWSGRARFLLNLPLFDREPLHPEVDALIDDFSSSVLLDVDLSQDLPFATQTKLVQPRLHAAVDHGAYSGVEVLRDLARANGGHQVFTPVTYTSAIGLGPPFSDAVQRCFGHPAWITSQCPQVWLDAQVTELDGGLLLNWDVREHAFEAEVVDAAFARMVAQLVDDPAAWQHLVPAQFARRSAPASSPGHRPRPLSPSPPLHETFFAHARSCHVWLRHRHADADRLSRHR